VLHAEADDDSRDDVVGKRRTARTPTSTATQ
jgi:hypothetical protein